jgi:hypothetical protein
MGLDIKVWTGPLEKVDLPQEDLKSNDFHERAYEEGWLVPYVPDEKLHREAPLQARVPYATHGSYSFHAGSYGGYNQYREALCEMALDATPQDVWHSYDEYAGRPFAEQINFSDCEGTIGPDVCRKLAGDYVAFRERAGDVLESYFFDVYERFREAFQHAADTGGAVNYW